MSYLALLKLILKSLNKLYDKFSEMSPLFVIDGVG